MLPGKTLLDYTNLFSPKDCKNTDKIIYNYLRIKVMSEYHKTTCKYLSYVEPLLILASTVTGCVSIYAFASLIEANVVIASSAVGIKICAITAGIKKCKPIIKKGKKKHDKMVLLEKANLDTIEVLISKAYIMR